MKVKMIAAVAFGLAVMCGATACGNFKSDEEIRRENAVAALEVCHEGEILEVVKPQTVSRESSDGSVYEVAAEHVERSSFGRLWAEDEWGYVPERTPKPTEKNPDPTPLGGFPTQDILVLRYELHNNIGIARLYVKPVHGMGSEQSPNLAPGSSGMIEFDPSAYAESKMVGGVMYVAPQIESISVCWQKLT